MLHDVIYQYTNIILNMIEKVKPFSNHLLWGLLILDVVFLGLNIAMGKTASVEAIVERLLFMGFVIYIISNFTSLSYMFRNSLIKILGYTGGIDQSIYNDPTQIMHWAQDHLIGPMNEAIKKVDQAYTAPQFNITQAGQWLSASVQHMTEVWNVRIIFNLIYLGVQLAFIIIAVEMTIARIEFYLIVLFALVIVPFIAWQPLRFIGTRAFTAVIAQALKLGIIVAIISLGMQVMNNLSSYMLSFTNLGSALNTQGLDLSILGLVLASCAVLVFLSIQVPALAMSLISGNPALSASGFGQNMMGIAAIGTAAVAGFRSIGASSQSSYHPTSPQRSYATNASGSSSVSSGPTSAGTPPGAAQNLFATAVGAGPSPSRSAAPVSGVNPVYPGSKPSTEQKQPADRMFQSVGPGGSSVKFNS